MIQSIPFLPLSPPFSPFLPLIRFPQQRPQGHHPKRKFLPIDQTAMKIYLPHAPLHSPSLRGLLKHRCKRGFALIATISIMVLLVMIALAMLSLSTNEVRASQNGRAMAEARANARMALTIAIGKLQLHAGSDMRITAPADIIDENMPMLTGVWRSWEGTNHTLTGSMTGRPTVPDYASKKISEASGGRLISWLVSGATPEVGLDQLNTLVSKTATPGSVALVGEGSLAQDDDRQVHVPLQTVTGSGKYAWWVSPENQKARLPIPQDPENDTVADWSTLVSNHSVSDPGVFGLESFLDDASPAEKTYTLGTADIYTDANADIRPGKSFHDLSPSSIGLLTNVATGGWRKDLSLLTERWDEQAEDELELFQLLPDESLKFNRPTQANMTTGSSASHSVPHSMPYHWAEYLNAPGKPATFAPGAIGSWTTLVNWATIYKKMSPSPSALSLSTTSYNSRDYYHRLHDIAVFEKIARLQFIASHYAIPGKVDPNKLIPCILYTPVITMWNPYNVEITENRRPYFRIDNSLPLALQYNIAGQAYPQVAVHKSRTYDNTITDTWTMIFRFPDNFTLKPGETKVFSPQANKIVDMRPSTFNRHNPSIDMKPNYRTGGGFYVALNQILDPKTLRSGQAHDPNKIELAGGTMIKVEKASFDTGSHSLCGVYGQWVAGGGSEWLETRYQQPEANSMYPPLTDLAAVSLAECRENPKPFLSIVLGARNASHTHQATKGFVQASPLTDAIQPGNAADHSISLPLQL